MLFTISAKSTEGETEVVSSDTLDLMHTSPKHTLHIASHQAVFQISYIAHLHMGEPGEELEATRSPYVCIVPRPSPPSLEEPKAAGSGSMYPLVIQHRGYMYDSVKLKSQSEATKNCNNIIVPLYPPSVLNYCS